MHTFTLRAAVVEEHGKQKEIGVYTKLSVLGDDGRELYDVRLLPDGSLEITANLTVVDYGGRRLENRLAVRPRDSSRIVVERPEYKEP